MSNEKTEDNAKYLGAIIAMGADDETLGRAVRVLYGDNDGRRAALIGILNDPREGDRFGILAAYLANL